VLAVGGALFEVHLRPDGLAWAAAPLRGPSAEPGPTEPPHVEARPQDSRTWALVLADDEDKLPLPAGLAERYHGNSQFNRVRLWLRSVAEPAAPLRWVIDVLPGPTKQPMTVVLGFPGGDHRTFVVSAEPGLPRKRTSSACEPLPGAALEANGNSPAVLREWPVSVEFH